MLVGFVSRQMGYQIHDLSVRCVARLSRILACSSAKFPSLPCLALIAAVLKRWACAGCLRAEEEIQAWWKLVEALPCDLTIMVLHELFDKQPDLSSRFKFNLQDREDQHVYSCQLWVRQTHSLTSVICFASSDSRKQSSSHQKSRSARFNAAQAIALLRIASKCV